MKFVKKLSIFAFLFIGLLLSNFINVNAEEAPSKITMKSKSSLLYYTEKHGTDYIGGYNFYRKQLTNGTYGYCISNINTKVPAGLTLSCDGPIDDMGLDYIIKNGYPNKSFTGNDMKDYYITQSAVWAYFDETRGTNNWKNNKFDSSSTGMKAYVYNLVQGAKAAKKTGVPTPDINLNIKDANMHLSDDEKYFVSEVINVGMSHTKGTYTVNLIDAPEGTKIKSTSGKTKSKFSEGEGFVIYVPVSKVDEGSGKVVLTVSAEGVVSRTYSYGKGNGSYQAIAPVTIYEKITSLTSSKLKLKFVKEVTKVKISKQDITSKKELAGATLIIKNSQGVEVAKWVSTDTPHYIEGLEEGEYTLIEISAPKGYELSTETIKFTVQKGGKVKTVVMYNTKEKEPTKYKISKQDITSKKELAGATLVIKDQNGNEVASWVSTNKPHYISNLAVGEYTLTETIAPEGYILSDETVKFVVKDDGSVTSVVMYNAKETKVTKVKISKQDITTKEELEGATLVIKDKNGNEVESWVSGKTPHYIEGLEAGEYTLTETIAPEGYELSSETIKFTIKDDGSITSVVMYNARYTEVPITDLNISSTTIIGAIVLVVLGTGMVFYAKRSY